MSYSPLLAPFTMGLQHNRAPWQCAPQSFQKLHNARIQYGYITSPPNILLKGQLPSHLPVTGIITYVAAGGVKNVLLFDTQNLYIKKENPVTFTQLNPSALFTQNFSFMEWTEMTTQKQGHTLFFTSGYERIWMYNPTLSPVIQEYPMTQTSDNETLTLTRAKMMVSVGGRLLLFGVSELEDTNTVTYDYRVRWSAAGDPLNLLDGGYADAATAEELIGIQTLQNNVLVTFSNGLWILESTWNSAKPFVWRKIDGNVRCFSRHSLIGYPLEVSIIGSRGYMSTDGRQVVRLDEAIPLFIEEDMNHLSGYSFFGFRDYINQTAWYLYKSNESTQKALIYDEISKSFSTYDVPFSVLGWGSDQKSYAFKDFTEENNMYWTLSSQVGKRLYDYQIAGEERVYGGDSQGNVYELTAGFEGVSTQSFPVKSVLETAAWNPYIEQGWQSRMLYLDMFVEGDAYQQVTLSFFKDEEIHPYLERKIDLMPHLGYVGEIIDIEVVNNNFIINCPDHGLLSPTLITLYGILGMTQLNNIANILATPTSADYLEISHLSLPTISPYLGGGKVFLRPVLSNKTWKRVYCGGTGYIHKVSMVFEGIGGTAFKLHALKPKFVPRSKRLI